MKKSIILAAAVAALTMFASCQKEDLVNESDGTGNDLVFTATIDNSATKLWGNNWRMPTQAELQALKANCTWSASSAGCTVTGKGDYASGSIFLPFAGCFDYDYKTVSGAGSSGSYWSSTYYDDGENDSAYDMYFNSSTPSVSEHNRKYGYSVRAVLAN